MIALTRCYRFPAAHVLAHPSLSPEENERTYGKCANPAGHGHEYRLVIIVSGPVGPPGARVLDRGVLDGLVEERVLARLGHRLLNDDHAFVERVPTAENIALLVHDLLEAPLARSGARLLRVRLQETRRNHFACGERA